MNTVTLRQPAEALVLIPHALGYHPSHHVVFLALDYWGTDSSGTRSRLGPLMVIDLESQALGRDVAEALCHTIASFGVRTCVLVLYTSDLRTIAHETRRGFHEACSQVSALIDAQEKGFVGAFLADSHHWAPWEEACDDPHSWKELESSEAAAHFVYEGSSPLQAVPPGAYEYRSQNVRQRAWIAEDNWWHRHRNNAALDGMRLWNRILTTEIAHAEGPEAYGEANAALHITAVRDRVLLYAQASEELLPLEDIPDDIVAEFRGFSPSMTPDITRCERVLAALDACASHSHDDDAAALAGGAFVCWWIGRNSWAAERTMLAREKDPDNTLAHLLSDVLASQIYPEWVSGGA